MCTLVCSFDVWNVAVVPEITAERQSDADGKTISDAFRKCARCHCVRPKSQESSQSGDDNDFKDLQIRSASWTNSASQITLARFLNTRQPVSRYIT